ncbi:MAG: PAS domain-containing protein [Gemmataceae bacterium]
MRILKSGALRDIWWFFLVILVANAGFTGFNIYWGARNQTWVNHSLQVLAQVNAVQATLTDAETAVRGYFATSDESYLQPFSTARPRLDDQLHQLRDLVSDMPSQTELVDLITRDAKLKLDNLDQLALRFRANGRAAVNQDMMQYGKQMMDRVRGHIGDLIAKENELLDERRRSLRNGVIISVLTTMLGNLAAIAMLGFVFYLIHRESQIQRRGEENVQAARAQTVSAQRESADALALLDTFFMNAPLGLAFFDRDLRFVRVNRYLAEANQVPVSECLGKTLPELLPNIASTASAELQKVTETGAAIIDRVVAEDARGRLGEAPVWQSSYYPVRDAGGTIIGIGFVTRNITERVRDEQRLKQSEERFRVLAETLPQIVWVTRPDGFLEFVNRRWSDYTGISVIDSYGTGWFTSLHKDDRPGAEGAWRQSLESGEPYEFEFRLRRADGTYRWFLGRAIPIRDEAGRPTRWFGTCTDIHGQKQAKEELEQMVRERTGELQQVVSTLYDEAQERERATEKLRLATEELSRSNRELEQFAYVASHDLQEPLRKIQAFGDRLQSRYKDRLDEQGQDYLLRMLNSAVRMRRLINDLLEFSRVTTKGHPFEIVDLNSVVADVLMDLEERITTTGAQLDIASLPTISADLVQMRQLFQNLLANALKFHKPGVPPSVSVRYQRVAHEGSADGQAWDHRIEVADKGIGFDEAYAGRLFQVFQRLHGRAEYEGTGIGLAVCRKIVERHGGTITARGRPSEGATFTITLPVRESHGPRSDQ